MPRKNVRPVGGKPLIAYSILAARNSPLLSQIVTSTDDAEIAQVAQQWGSQVLLRPPELASDDAPMLPVIVHVLTELANLGQSFDYVVVLQPTTPLRNAEDIDAALTILHNSGADTVISVYQVSDTHPARMYRLEDETLVPYAVEPSNRLRQELPRVYHRNGAIYALRRSLIEEQLTLIGKNLRPYIMPRERSINIDEEIDLLFADFLLQHEAS